MPKPARTRLPYRLADLRDIGNMQMAGSGENGPPVRLSTTTIGGTTMIGE